MLFKYILIRGILLQRPDFGIMFCFFKRFKIIVYKLKLLIIFSIFLIKFPKSTKAIKNIVRGV